MPEGRRLTDVDEGGSRLEWLWAALLGLACVAIMLLICVPMIKGRKNDHSDESDIKEEVSALRPQLAQLRLDAGARRDRSSEGHGIA
jgi:hypothetical protein